MTSLSPLAVVGKDVVPRLCPGMARESAFGVVPLWRRANDAKESANAPIPITPSAQAKRLPLGNFTLLGLALAKQKYTLHLS